MDLGFRWAGFRHAFFAEIDPFGRAVLAERFPGVPMYSDVRDVPECGSGIPWGEPRGSRDTDGADVLKRARPVPGGESDSGSVVRSDRRLDVLTFGSPCQDLSIAGKRRGLDGDRSGLFWEAMRIAGDGPLRPRALLMENVEGLLSSNGGRDFALVLDAMAERGYRWSYRVLDSQHFAVPQRRRRVFVCAVADDDPRAERIGEVFALAESSGGDSPTSDPSWPEPPSAARGGASGGGVVGALTGRNVTRLDDQCAGGGHLVPAITRKWAKGSGGPAGDEHQNLVWSARSPRAVVQPAIGFSHTQGLDPQAREERTPTLRSNEAGMAANVGPAVRRLTPLECERLQGWPDDWTDIPWNGKDHAPDSRRYAACGNGVTATVAYWIAARLAEVLK
jgi:DNA (cytosine-5)-methyltransferase 1